MIVGFTGTREGLSLCQYDAFDRYVCELPSFTEFHHGACVGASERAAGQELRYRRGLSSVDCVSEGAGGAAIGDLGDSPLRQTAATDNADVASGDPLERRHRDGRESLSQWRQSLLRSAMCFVGDCLCCKTNNRRHRHSRCRRGWRLWRSCCHRRRPGDCGSRWLCSTGAGGRRYSTCNCDR